MTTFQLLTMAPDLIVLIFVGAITKYHFTKLGKVEEIFEEKLEKVSLRITNLENIHSQLHLLNYRLENIEKTLGRIITVSVGV